VTKIRNEAWYATPVSGGEFHGEVAWFEFIDIRVENLPTTMSPRLRCFLEDEERGMIDGGSVMVRSAPVRMKCY